MISRATIRTSANSCRRSRRSCDRHSPGQPNEPRGCPRGAAFSWYTYSPTRVRYPYVRGTLLRLYREAKQRLGDPVLAWADVVSDPDRRTEYQKARGKGGLIRASWDEAVEIIAAAHVHTIKTWGPDRVAGFSPIPAMSMVSHAADARFMSLIGAPMLSFYDWYCDLPVASPQVFGDQTDVPESGDWWDAAYLIMWSSNVPVTNHWFHAETIYRAFFALLQLTGCQGRNDGGWAHYVGQEKCRPSTGWATLAGALDWNRPPRQMIGTGYWYVHTSQWRYDQFGASELSSPLAEGRLAGMSAIDCLAAATRMGWMPSYPTFDRNPLDLADEAGDDPARYVVDAKGAE
jgi:nitrate reductase alpha subunit